MQNTNNLGPLMPGMTFERITEGGKQIVIQAVFNNGVEYRELKCANIGDICTFAHLRPIPLTPEILRDWFGFKNDLPKWGLPFSGIEPHEYWYKVGAGFGCIFHDYNGRRWTQTNVSSGEGCSLHPKYVHELQRLLAGLGLDHTVKIDQ